MIKINIPKAKEIAHGKRRAKREQEFKPHDEAIMKQIPGKDANAAEVARQAIRDKYDAIQTNIDACVDADSIKAVMVNEGLI